MSAKRCPHKVLPGPALDGVLWCDKCNAEVIRGYILADTLDGLENKIPWAVGVEALPGKNNFRTMFKVGVQSFTVAHAEDIDEAEIHCQRIAELFSKAMQNAGFGMLPASEDWALDQLTQVGTLVGSHNAAEALGDVRALVVEVANGTGPLAEECRKRLAFAAAIHEADIQAGRRSRIVQVAVQVNGEMCGTVPLPENASDAHALSVALTFDSASLLIGRARQKAARDTVKFDYTPGKVINIITENT